MSSEILEFLLGHQAVHPWHVAVVVAGLVAWRKLPRRMRRRARRWAWRNVKGALGWAWRRATAARKPPSRRPSPSPHSAQRPDDWTWPVEPGGPTVLYRYYDADWVLLYIGITGVHRGGQRNLEHADKPWYPQMRHYRISEPYPTRADALYAEAIAIRDEKPIHNIARPDPARIGRP